MNKAGVLPLEKYLNSNWDKTVRYCPPDEDETCGLGEKYNA